jgi:hypothetical protein
MRSRCTYERTGMSCPLAMEANVWVDNRPRQQSGAPIPSTSIWRPVDLTTVVFNRSADVNTSLPSFTIDHLTLVHPQPLSATILLPLPSPERTPYVHISVDFTALGALKMSALLRNECTGQRSWVQGFIKSLLLLLFFFLHPGAWAYLE